MDAVGNFSQRADGKNGFSFLAKRTRRVYFETVRQKSRDRRANASISICTSRLVTMWMKKKETAASLLEKSVLKIIYQREKCREQKEINKIFYQLFFGIQRKVNYANIKHTICHMNCVLNILNNAIRNAKKK